MFLQRDKFTKVSDCLVTNTTLECLLYVRKIPTYTEERSVPG